MPAQAGARMTAAREASVTVIGREITTNAFFTEHVARTLGLPQLCPMAGESGSEYLMRRLKQLQWCSRAWGRCDLEALSPALFELAAQQICYCAADMAQDVLAIRERVRRGQCRNPYLEGSDA
jgi:hypothetical protein